MNGLFEKIIRELSEKRDEAEKNMELSDVLSDVNAYGGMFDAFDKSIGTVMKIAEEYNNGWIPCSSGKMPEEHDSIFAKAKGTDKWYDAMFEKISDDVNVTVEFEDGTRKTMTLHTNDGKWNTNNRIVKFNVIAWQPLPEPYTKG